MCVFWFPSTPWISLLGQSKLRKDNRGTDNKIVGLARFLAGQCVVLPEVTALQTVVSSERQRLLVPQQRKSALWACGWSREGELRSCWVLVLSTAITMARGAPSQCILLERRGPPMLPNSGDVQVARLRTFCWLCAWVSHCLFFFLKRFFLTGDEQGKKVLPSPLFSWQCEERSGREEKTNYGNWCVRHGGRGVSDEKQVSSWEGPDF